MAFHKFTEQSSRHSATGSVNERGVISFSQGSRRRFGIQEGSYGVLYYDPEQKLIAVQLIANGEEEGAKQIRLGDYGATIRAKPFIDYFNIPVQTTLRMELTQDENGYIVFDLKKAKARMRGGAKDVELDL